MDANLSALERVVVVATRYAQKYDRANPNVGMGPSVDLLLADVVREANLSLDRGSRARILHALVGDAGF